MYVGLWKVSNQSIKILSMRTFWVTKRNRRDQFELFPDVWSRGHWSVPHVSGRPDCLKTNKTRKNDFSGAASIRILGSRNGRSWRDRFRYKMNREEIINSQPSTSSNVFSLSFSDDADEANSACNLGQPSSRSHSSLQSEFCGGILHSEKLFLMSFQVRILCQWNEFSPLMEKWPISSKF